MLLVLLINYSLLHKGKNIDVIYFCKARNNIYGYKDDIVSKAKISTFWFNIVNLQREQLEILMRIYRLMSPGRIIICRVNIFCGIVIRIRYLLYKCAFDFMKSVSSRSVVFISIHQQLLWIVCNERRIKARHYLTIKPIGLHFWFGWGDNVHISW